MDSRSDRRALTPHATLEGLLDALESAGLGCTVIVTEGERLERVYANEAIARIYGVDLETMRKLPPISHAVPGERRRLHELRKQVREGAPAPAMEATTIVRPDGTTVPVELGLAYSVVDDKRTTFVFMRDVTARAAMETALRESEDRFRQLAEASPDPITVSVGNRYTYANPAALRVLGLASLDDLRTFDPKVTVEPGRMPEIAEHIARIARGERPPPLVHRLVRDDGEAFFEASLSTVTIDGAPAIVSWSRDITERIRLQAEIMKQDRLASVGTLAAGVAHELNNPLMTLGLQTRWLQAQAAKLALPPSFEAALEQIDDAAQRMQSIIGDLLFMSRPVEQPQAHVDLSKIISSAIALLRAGIPGCAPIHADLPALPPIRGYPSKLGQVFVNVLRNALQAVEGIETGEVRVTAEAVDDRIVVTIHDNGPGIPREVLARIAQPFFTTKSEGTGLGLWISQSIMAQHEGSLDVTSTPSTGTTVKLTLPA